MKAIRNNIPNAITSLNLLFGCLAIIAAFNWDEPFRGSFSGYQLAFLLIALAAVADFCDGLVARALHAVSNIGAELDSLADLVSFGIAPAMVLYNIMMERWDVGSWAFASMLIPVFGALRLARYNVDPTQGTVFTGLPIPANAIFWIGLTAWYADNRLPLWLVIVLIVALSLLMVCRLRMFSLKMHNLTSLKENWAQYLQIIATVAFVAFLGLPGLAAAIALYVLLSTIKKEAKE